MPTLDSRSGEGAAVPATTLQPLLGTTPGHTGAHSASDEPLLRLGQLDTTTQRKVANRDAQKKGYAWWQWLMLISFGVIFGLANGADNTASSLRALPAMVQLSAPWLQVVMGALSFLGALMNFMIVMMAFPLLLKFLKQKFVNGGKKGRGEVWELSNTKKAAIIVGGVFTFLTCIGIGFFTFNSVPTTIIGIAAVFGFELSTGGLAIPIIAGILAVMQGLSMFLMLFKDTVHIISNASWKNLQSFLMIGPYKPKTTQEHFIRAGRLLMNVIGASILLLAAAFMIFGQASAANATLIAAKWPPVAVHIFTGVFVYCIASLSHFAIRVCSANGVFGKFGDYLGKKIGYQFSNQAERRVIDRKRLREKMRKQSCQKAWKDKSPPEKIQTVLQKLWPLTFLALIGNTIGNALSGMRGDHLLRPGASTDGSAFHAVANAIADDPTVVHDVTPAPLEVPALASAAINGAASATLASYFVFAGDLSDHDKPKEKASRRANASVANAQLSDAFGQADPFGVNPHLLLARTHAAEQFAYAFSTAETPDNNAAVPNYF